MKKNFKQFLESFDSDKDTLVSEGILLANKSSNILKFIDATNSKDDTLLQVYKAIQELNVGIESLTHKIKNLE
jgi:hypothetical protein